MKNSTRRIALGTIIFGVVGYVAGILTAPKEGAKTRESIKNIRDSGISEAEKQLKKLHTELNQLLGEVKDQVKSDATAATQNADDQALVGEVMTKAKRARQKTLELLSALHDGNADDRDLDKAVNEATKAIKSIRNYLRK